MQVWSFTSTIFQIHTGENRKQEDTKQSMPERNQDTQIHIIICTNTSKQSAPWHSIFQRQWQKIASRGRCNQSFHSTTVHSCNKPQHMQSPNKPHIQPKRHYLGFHNTSKITLLNLWHYFYNGSPWMAVDSTQNMSALCSPSNRTRPNRKWHRQIRLHQWQCLKTLLTH